MAPDRPSGVPRSAAISAFLRSMPITRAPSASSRASSAAPLPETEPEPHVLDDAGADDGLGELLAHDGLVAHAHPLCEADDVLELSTALRATDHGALVAERRLRDAPAVVHVAEDVAGRDAHVGEE